MEKQQKKRIKRYISWGLSALLVAVLAFMPLLAAENDPVEGPQASVLSGKAERRAISTHLIGGGTLTAGEAVEITIPSEVKLTGYLVRNGDAVAEGDAIAEVDRVSVMSAIAQVQETLDYLAEEIEASGDEQASDKVVAQAGGVVKAVYAEKGEDVRDVMLEHGALAVLSLDGLMAVRIERSTGLHAGDTVCVTLSDGTEINGAVESNLEGVLTVTVSDDGYPVGEQVQVTTLDGDRIGSGTLYIHSRWNAVAYSGTVSEIRIREGDTVNAGRTLIRLKDTGHTGSYQQMIDQHREYEELMLELFRMYQSETITAPCAGVISGVDEDGIYMLSESGSQWKLQFLANAPNGDDETSYANFVGQVTAVGIDGLIMRMNPQQLNITDYKDLSAIPVDTSLMTEEVIYTAQAPVYELAEGEWVQLEASAIAVGDILLFASDAGGDFVWVVRAAAGQDVPEMPDPGEPTAPTEPPEATEPEAPTDSTQPDNEKPTEPSDSEQPTNPMNPGTTWPGGKLPNAGSMGGSIQKEEYALYTLETVSIASVSDQEEMTVAITIDELDILKMFLGQTAEVTVNALNGQSFPATVTEISNTGVNNGGNSKFTVELTLARSGDMLPGMSASVMITLNTAEDCVAVPVAALTEIGSGTVLYTGYDEESGELINPVAVTVGVSDGEYAQILSGFDEEMVYYYTYYDTLVISDAPDGGLPFGR